MSEQPSSPTLSTSLAKLLCVDDDPGVLASVVRLLGRDFQVLTAASSNEAMMQLDAHPDIAIVLADQGLPGTSGLQFLSQVQNKNPDAVRALFSGYVELKDLVEAVNTSRIHRLILKPWENEYFRVQMLESLANHSTLLEKRHLESLAVTDPVTNLKNHRYFQDRLRIECERAFRHARPLSLAMLDLDHFKHVNDRFGHPVGDLCLKGVAMRLLDQTRSIDTVARYGGEEFAILMPDTPNEKALLVAERIRTTFAQTAFQFPQLPAINITLSIGLASLPISTDGSTSGAASLAASLAAAPDLVVRADEALYRAKGQGRNRTVGD